MAVMDTQQHCVWNFMQLVGATHRLICKLGQGSVLSYSMQAQLQQHPEWTSFTFVVISILKQRIEIKALAQFWLDCWWSNTRLMLWFVLANQHKDSMFKSLYIETHRQTFEAQTTSLFLSRQVFEVGSHPCSQCVCTSHHKTTIANYYMIACYHLQVEGMVTGSNETGRARRRTFLSNNIHWKGLFKWCYFLLTVDAEVHDYTQTDESNNCQTISDCMLPLAGWRNR